jgi:predicted DNA-binding transcriptional regulator AlpA
MENQKTESTNNLPLALVNFDAMPNSAQVRLPVVTALLGISPATAWRMVKAQTLKAYRHTPRTTTFNVGELRAFIAAQGGV